MTLLLPLKNNNIWQEFYFTYVCIYITLFLSNIYYNISGIKYFYKMAFEIEIDIRLVDLKLHVQFDGHVSDFSPFQIS